MMSAYHAIHHPSLSCYTSPLIFMPASHTYPVIWAQSLLHSRPRKWLAITKIEGDLWMDWWASRQNIHLCPHLRSLYQFTVVSTSKTVWFKVGWSPLFLQSLVLGVVVGPLAGRDEGMCSRWIELEWLSFLQGRKKAQTGTKKCN